MTTDEKLQQAADNHAKVRRYKGDEYDYHNRYNAFIQGAKSPESLKYHKEKEKLYTEEELKYYAERFAHYIQQEKRPEGVLTGWHKWFKQNKK